MSAKQTKIYVQTSVEQENIKNARKSLQTIQKTATDKENLVGRLPAYAAKEHLAKPVVYINDELPKHKRPEIASTSSQTSPDGKQITAADLTAGKPSEVYWEILAEERRLALEETLEENKSLYEQIKVLETDLKAKEELLDEARALVEVFSEMVEDKAENDANEAAEAHVSVAEEAMEREMDELLAAVKGEETEISPKKQKTDEEVTSPAKN